MLQAIVKKIFGTEHDRQIKALQPVLDRINTWENKLRDLSDQELQEKTPYFKQIIQDRIQKGEKASSVLDDLLPEAFAVCREASRRVLRMRHFDVQMIGGIVLHQGKIAEMRTGEGKTLVATLPVYLNALLGRGVHVVTVNDYLAKRDSEWMGKLYKFLGLSVGVIVNELSDAQRKEAYGADVTYGQNNEFGFDYLRDNMKYRLEDYVQRDLYFAIVDEVDSILIDEARTPLIISGPTDDFTEKYASVNRIIPSLKAERDFTLDEKSKNALLTEEGVSHVESLLGIDNLYDPQHIETLHHVNQALRAHKLFHKDVDYMVKEGEVLIVDEFTGRVMPGRRWSDGLHQAIEAKENLTIANENQTLASITFQNYFRMFEKLSGMTGTADTEAEEFHKIYKLDVSVIPTNKPLMREDFPDIIYATEQDKYKAMAQDIRALYEKKQPVLVGTVSIEKSERLSKYLKREGVPHNVLNAKHHEREAEIVKNAGQASQVTIATNMAGRGTDIVLGEGVKEAGGLFIIGTERHESRRIDNQLRGRSGRQGDPGGSRFYLSLEDDLMRIFASDRVQKILEWAGMKEGEAIEHKMTTKAIEGAQRRVEGHNFDIRKHLIKYDDVMNQQRKVIYALRKDVLGRSSIREVIEQDIAEITEDWVLAYTQPKVQVSQWDWEALSEVVLKVFGHPLPYNVENWSDSSQESIHEALIEFGLEKLDEKEKELGDIEFARMIEREIKLRTIDALWKDHLHNMDQLKESVGFQGYAQKDPLNEYKKSGFDMFSEMVYSTKESALTRMFHVQVSNEQDPSVFKGRKAGPMQMGRGEAPGGQGGISAQSSSEGAAAIPGRSQIPNMKQAQAATIRRDGEKVGRNDPCPCGSGKKYKKCHGAN
ncbi:MAG: preprotein translocase subunit SecA [Bdellovibrionales bacterium]|nr:preprotein translocase subunit SecA [Bdellovibrionales bacterium]